MLEKENRDKTQLKQNIKLVPLPKNHRYLFRGNYRLIKREVFLLVSGYRHKKREQRQKYRHRIQIQTV